MFEIKAGCALAHVGEDDEHLSSEVRLLGEELAREFQSAEDIRLLEIGIEVGAALFPRPNDLTACSIQPFPEVSGIVRHAGRHQ
jgi:hypothetical protein